MSDAKATINFRAILEAHPQTWTPRKVRPLIAGTVPPVTDRRAAVYVRMSTDQQRYSTANQLDAITSYAAEHNFEITKTYADEGRSGLTLDGRDGLRQLLAEVAQGNAPYGTVLVYDVSRWGRFQDTDESAFYEYFCRREGIHVEYCMEQFANDGSPISAVVKGIKRIMAAEYSRELSTKVFAGKCRQVRMGHKQGGRAPFGLRRMLVDATGRPRGILHYGELKAVQTDRIIMVPGPRSEVDVVNQVYKRVLKGGQLTPIAADLNRRGIRTPSGKPWSADRVLSMVTNELYIGNLVYNRTSIKLKGERRRNPPDQWVRKDGAFQAIVDPDLFRKVQKRISRWTTRISDEAALEALRQLWKQHGTLSQRLIESTPGIPNPHFYFHRFGGITGAYRRIGFKPRRSYLFLEGYRERCRRTAELRRDIEDRLRGRGARVHQLSPYQYMVNGRRVGVMLAYAHPSHRYGEAKWVVQMVKHPRPEWVLIARNSAANTEIMDYCLAKGGAQSIDLGWKHKKMRVWYAGPSADPILDALVSPDGPAPAVAEHSVTTQDVRTRRQMTGCAHTRQTPQDHNSDQVTVTVACH